MQGTAHPCRVLENEMQVSNLANIPDPPFELSPQAQREYYIICQELLAKKMLHLVDLSLLTAYSNEMALYIEKEKTLKTTGRIDEFYNEDICRAPAVQFGLTPSARTRIAMPEVLDNTFKL